MSLVDRLRAVYRHHIHTPRLDRVIYSVLDALTNCYSWWRGYSFPNNYIRRWKLDMLWWLYEKETVALFKKIIKPGMVIVDVGAHIGYFTRLFSKLVGETGLVYAFEADPDNFQLLQKNTAPLRNVKLFELAIADRLGTIDFYHYDEKAGCHSILPNVPLDFKKRKITVQADQLDTLLERQGIQHIDLIKMDIEGGESAALRGMMDTLKNRGVSMMITEFAPAWIKAAGGEPLKFLQNIAALGFRLFAIKDETLLPIDTANDSYVSLIPKTPTHFNEFINLYCVRN